MSDKCEILLNCTGSAVSDLHKLWAPGQTNLHKPHSRTYGSLRWPWSCEIPDTLHSRDANHRKTQAVFWRGQTFDGTAKICHLYMDLGSGAKHQGGEIQAVFFCCSAQGLPHQCSSLTLWTPLHPACGLQPWACYLEGLQLIYSWRAITHISQVLCAYQFLLTWCDQVVMKSCTGVSVLPGTGWSLSLMVKEEGQQINFLGNK